MSFDPALAFVRHAGCDVRANPEPTGRPGFYVCGACSAVFEFHARPSTSLGHGVRDAHRGSRGVPAGGRAVSPMLRAHG